MSNGTATAIANPNIALIKYWGDRDVELHIPANGSISMNLSGLFTRTTVTRSSNLHSDEMTINGVSASNTALSRTSGFLNHFRQLYGFRDHFIIESTNNFPSAAGIASSASAFAALSLAVTKACDLNLSEADLSRLARLGSGSACRSIPGGFVEWQAGNDHESSFAFAIAPHSHWDLVDHIVIVSEEEKEISSRLGHEIAHTSPLQQARIIHTGQRLKDCRHAILSRDFNLLANVVELDSNLMHAIMLTSSPPLIYWQPATIAIMQSVIDWRKNGLAVCYTVDAGANVHVLCEEANSPAVAGGLHEIPSVLQVIDSKPGGPAFLEEKN